jgi:osmotically-inducible protein OsmY
VKTGQYVDDTAVTTKVKSKLATDETVSALDVHVETVKGTVRLSGFVKNPDHKRRAEQLAWSVEGVHSVDNGLVVQNP